MIFHEVQNVGGGGWLSNRICCRLVRAVFILVLSYVMSIADEMMRSPTKRTHSQVLGLASGFVKDYHH